MNKKLLKYGSFMTIATSFFILPFSYMVFKANIYQANKEYKKAIQIYDILGNISTTYKKEKVYCYYKKFMELYKDTNNNKSFMSLYHQICYPFINSEAKKDNSYNTIELFNILKNINTLSKTHKNNLPYRDLYSKTKLSIDNINVTDKKCLYEILHLTEINYYTSSKRRNKNLSEVLDKTLKAHNIYKKGIKENYTPKFILQSQVQIINSYLNSYIYEKDNIIENYEKVMKDILLEFLEINSKFIKVYGNHFSLSALLPYNKEEKIKAYYKNFKEMYKTPSSQENIFKQKYPELADMPYKFFLIYSKKLPEYHTLGYFLRKRSEYGGSYAVASIKEKLQEIVSAKHKSDKDNQFKRDIFNLLEIRHHYLCSCELYYTGLYDNGIKELELGKKAYTGHIKDYTPNKYYTLNYHYFVFQEFLDKVILLKEQDPITKDSPYFQSLLYILKEAKKENMLLESKYGKQFKVEYNLDHLFE